MTPQVTWRFAPLGEGALLVHAHGPPADLANRYALALSRVVDALSFPGIQSALPGIDSVLVAFDPLSVARGVVERRIESLTADLQPAPELPERVVDIPVVFGGKEGPDLEDAGRALSLSTEDIIAALTARAYRVMMIGFAYGFPYIGPLPTCLDLPRRSTPRVRVPAGSVAIAAGMAGIYPVELPGGWRLVGRTSLRLFDPANERQPAVLSAGDGVRFVAA